jgi:two-component system chemotaxis response regulator CheB
VRGLPTSLAPGRPPELTGLSCPECYGVLDVSIEGVHDFILFRCQTGHTFTPSELLRGKEGRVETLLRASFTAFEELGRLLVDLLERREPGLTPANGAQRLEVVRRHASELKAILQENAPVILEDDAPERE